MYHVLVANICLWPSYWLWYEMWANNVTSIIQYFATQCLQWLKYTLGGAKHSFRIDFWDYPCVSKAQPTYKYNGLNS